MSALSAESELRSPAWTAPAHVFRGEAFAGGTAGSDDDMSGLPHLALIIDVRCLAKPVAGGAARAQQQGWAVLPLFAGAGYVASGVFRLPLYQTAAGGEPPLALLEQIATDGARGVLARARAERRVRLVEGASVDVALFDVIRADEWEGAPLPEPDASALLEAVDANPRALDKYKPSRASSKLVASALEPAGVPEASVRAKFELALGFGG